MKRLGPGLLTLALTAAAFAPLAHAADLPVPAAPAPAPVYYHPAIYDWTGIYIGGHVGAGLTENTFNPIGGGTLAGVPTGSTNVNGAGFIGGAQVGVNYEFAPWVVGLEVSWTSSNINQSGVGSTTAVAGNQLQETVNPQWFGAATARAGYANDAWLYYVKGGVGWVKDNYTQTNLLLATTVGTSTLTDNRTGYTVGAGIEYGLTENFSAKVEYDFYDFGKTNYNFAFAPMSVSNNIHTFLFGMNYRFNWAGGRAPY